MGTTLDPTAFQTIADKPRHQQYHIENENNEATTQEINGKTKKNSFTVYVRDETLFFYEIYIDNCRVIKFKSFLFAFGSILTLYYKRILKRGYYTPCLLFLYVTMYHTTFFDS